MQRVGSMVSERDNPDGDVPQQPEGVRREAGCGAPIPLQGITGRRGGGVAIPDQWEGKRFNALPQDKHGNMKKHTGGVRRVVTRRRRCRAAIPCAHLGPTLGHSPYGMAEAE